MVSELIEKVEQKQLKKNKPQFDIGDTVDVHVRIVEGEKERVQVFNGTVIARKGYGINETFTVRRIVNNEGVERIFPVHSPSVVKVAVKRSGYTRRSKLYFLRQRAGKAVRLREVWTGKSDKKNIK
ncbi:MAG: 50S ribosomal protein L19 [Sedimentisphaerales bacterium]|nr:50S ribosomal protein L19 [Sedimentisphaerales bacterium]